MAAKQKQKRPGHGAKRAPGARGAPSGLWLYGRHAVAAALANPERALRKVLATPTALEWLKASHAPGDIVRRTTLATPEEIDRLLPSGAVHQGLAAEVDDLPRARLKDICEHPSPSAPVLVLDQVSDPQNIGALFRSGAAFGARAIVVQERRTPPLAGALAKAAAGAVETLPCVSVVNIARAIEGLQGLGYHCAGLAGEAEPSIERFPANTPIAIVLGAEGAGLRKLVGETCNALYRIPIADQVESLNVSTAAAIALYQATRPSDS